MIQVIKKGITTKVDIIVSVDALLWERKVGDWACYNPQDHSTAWRRNSGGGNRWRGCKYFIFSLCPNS
jgi:hypothetical protein